VSKWCKRGGCFGPAPERTKRSQGNDCVAQATSSNVSETGRDSASQRPWGLVAASLALGPLTHDRGLLKGVERRGAREDPLEGEGDVFNDESAILGVLGGGLDVVGGPVAAGKAKTRSAVGTCERPCTKSRLTARAPSTAALWALVRWEAEEREHLRGKAARRNTADGGRLHGERRAARDVLKHRHSCVSVYVCFCDGREITAACVTRASQQRYC